MSILSIAGIHSTSNAYHLHFESLTKYEALFIHIVNVFWLCIELSDKISELQWPVLADN